MKKTLASIPLLFHLLLSLSSISSATPATHEPPYTHTGTSSIIFATLGRSDYAFDIFSLPLSDRPYSIISPPSEIQLTDGQSVNFNGHFPSHLNNNQTNRLDLVYVTERNGSHSVFHNAVYLDRSGLEVSARVQFNLLEGKTGISMKDKPSLVGERLIYVSTHEDPGQARASWAAVYSTELLSGLTRRLTPIWAADFSPAVSPSGEYTAVASYGEGGWRGEVEELSTGIYVFLTRDGTQRVKVVEHGGWPTWVDDSTLYFHRRSEEDGWISVYVASLPSHEPVSTESVITRRVTPPGLHAFTPAASPGNYEFIAVATRRPGSNYRHIELFDLVKNEFVELTRLVSPNSHHLNPFLTPDSGRVGYHRCRGSGNDDKSAHLLLENIRSPVSEVSLFRVDGSFPSFSPGGDRIAYVGFPGVYVVNRDGSDRRWVYPDLAFSTTWDPVRKGVVYFATGPTFASESTEVDILCVDVDGFGGVKKLTTNGKNNAFPSVSPNGKWVVFRSGRSGYKNLYVMDAVKGESGWLHRLTEGPWSDTMCNWSPDGEWIAFASDRENPGSGSFELYLVHPNGTGLRKLAQSGSGGRANHPYFSPDGKSIVFTSDYAGISAEPISNPHHYQPYGDIFIINVDGSGLKRLTHNSYEDGTPAWGPAYMRPKDVEWPNYGPQCSFEDCHWLNKMPNQGLDSLAETLEYSKPQCGSGQGDKFSSLVYKN